MLTSMNLVSIEPESEKQNAKNAKSDKMRHENIYNNTDIHISDKMACKLSKHIELCELNPTTNSNPQITHYV